MSLFPVAMESERLRYERLHPDEFDPLELYEYVRSDAPHIDEITRYMTWDPYDNPKEAHEWVTQCGNAFDDGETATYVVRPKEGSRADEFAGLCGLGIDWGTQSAELGVWLRKPFWGQGYSGERAGRLLELAFDRLDLELVRVSHDPDNDLSRRAITRYVERFGGRKEGRVRNDIVMNSEPRDSIRYSISREEWEGATGRPGDAENQPTETATADRSGGTNRATEQVDRPRGSVADLI